MLTRCKLHERSSPYTIASTAVRSVLGSGQHQYFYSVHEDEELGRMPQNAHGCGGKCLNAKMFLDRFLYE